MSRAECGIIGLCPVLTKDSNIKNCDECEKRVEEINAFLRERYLVWIQTEEGRSCLSAFAKWKEGDKSAG
jgi:hypothetical protein